MFSAHSHQRATRRLRLALSASIVFFASCHATVGRVEEGRYIAYDDAFSLPVPRLSVGMGVQQGLDKDTSGHVTAGYVNFHDDFANLRSIEFEELSPARVAALADAAYAKKFASERLRDRYFDKLKPRFPGARVADEEALVLADGTAASFAMIKIVANEPVRANKSAKTPERSPDATRGFLFFLHREQYFTLSLANDPRGMFEASGTSQPSEPEEIERLKQEITALYDTIHFGRIE
jgi:hypothetical protein